MAEISIVKISALPVAEQIGDEDLLALAQDGATKALAYGTIKEDISEELAPDATLSEAGKAADAKAVGDALALKADTTTVNAAVSRIDAALATKANTNDVNAALATKANADEVAAALALKADATTVNAELATKANTDTVNAALALKADKTEVTAGLAAKQNVLTFDTTPTENSTNPVTSGGIYQAIPALDDTLTVAGDAADAKATGDTIVGLKNDLRDIDAFNPHSSIDLNDTLTWELGSIRAENGEPFNSSTRIRTVDFMDLSEHSGLRFEVDAGYRYVVFFYDASGALLPLGNLLQWKSTTIVLTQDYWGDAAKIKIIMSDSTNGAASVDFAEHLRIYAVTEFNSYAVERNTLDETALCVMSFNVQKWTGLNGNLNTIADIIYSYNPDIIFIQEQANRPGAVSDSVLAVYKYYYQASGITAATAIYSKLPLENLETVLYSTYGTEQRAFIHATVTINGNTVHIYNTHLDLDETARHAQATELFNQVKNQEYFICAGDFNSFEAINTSGADYIGEIKQFIDANLKSLNCSYQHGFLYTYYNGNTIADSTIRHCLDQIFTSYNIDMDNVYVDKRKDKASNTSAIDHLPIVAYCHVNG